VLESVRNDSPFGVAVAMTELARRIDVKLGTLILTLLAVMAAIGVTVSMLP
jgi:hypothetical protein